MFSTNCLMEVSPCAACLRISLRAPPSNNVAAIVQTFAKCFHSMYPYRINRSHVSQSKDKNRIHQALKSVRQHQIRAEITPRVTLEDSTDSGHHCLEASR